MRLIKPSDISDQRPGMAVPSAPVLVLLLMVSAALWLLIFAAGRSLF